MAKNYRSQLMGVFGCTIDEYHTGEIEKAAFENLGIATLVNKENLSAAAPRMTDLWKLLPFLLV